MRSLDLLATGLALAVVSASPSLAAPAAPAKPDPWPSPIPAAAARPPLQPLWRRTPGRDAKGNRVLDAEVTGLVNATAIEMQVVFGGRRVPGPLVGCRLRNAWTAFRGAGAGHGARGAVRGAGAVLG